MLAHCSAVAWFARQSAVFVTRQTCIFSEYCLRLLKICMILIFELQWRNPSKLRFEFSALTYPGKNSRIPTYVYSLLLTDFWKNEAHFRNHVRTAPPAAVEERTTRDRHLLRAARGCARVHFYQERKTKIQVVFTTMFYWLQWKETLCVLRKVMA